MINIIQEADYQISKWSGGLTKQIYIMPENADYAKRDFTMRISSATVEVQESDFTHLPDVKRYLTILSGNMELTINGKDPEVVTINKIIEFSGEDQVHCVGTATDLNLMLKGAKGRMYVANGGNGQLKRQNDYFLYAASDMLLYYTDLTGKVKRIEIAQGDTCHIHGEEGSYALEDAKQDILVIEVECA